MSTFANAAGAPALERAVPAHRRWTARLSAAPLLALALGLWGCTGTGGDPAGGTALTPEQFIEVIVALREAEREVAEEDSAAALFEERKRAILDRHGTTEEELRGFIVAHHEELPVLQAAWDTITERLKHARPAAESWDGPEGDPRADPDGTDPGEAEARKPARLRPGAPPVPGGAEVH